MVGAWSRWKGFSRGWRGPGPRYHPQAPRRTSLFAEATAAQPTVLMVGGWGVGGLREYHQARREVTLCAGEPAELPALLIKGGW